MNEGVQYQDKPWLKHYDGGVPEFVEYESVCMPEYLDRSAKRFPDQMALNFQGYTITFRELKEMVDRMASCLAGFGVKKGDAVAILLPNIIPCVAANFAILRLGGVVVMNNPLYTDRELLHQFNDSEAKLLITLDLLANRMIDLRPKTRIRQIIYTSIGDYLPFPSSVLFKMFGKRKKLSADVREATDVYKWKDVIAKNDPAPPAVELTFDDVAMYQYTGGTTGVSKGVILTHGNLSKQVQQVIAWFPEFEPGNIIMLGALPFFHVFGMSTSMNLSVFAGWGNVLVPKPQPGPLLKAISKYKPNFAPLVPTMFIGILNHPKIGRYDLTSIKGCFSGSAPLPVEVIKTFEKKTGSVIVEGFGLTETTPVTHVNPMGGSRKIGSVGLPIPDTQCRIVSLEDGVTDMPMGESGELLVRGPQVMTGYRNMPEETAKTLTDEGWLHTGDIGKMDEDGYFYIVDRKKDMIISGGYNVYPRDIEEVYYEHEKVQECCAVGIPHETRGEAVKLFIVLKEGETATPQEMMEHGKTRLAKFKWPVEFEFRDALPKTNVGKILRKELRNIEMENRKSIG